MIYSFVFLGEFGYELFNWQGVIRKWAQQNKKKDDKPSDIEGFDPQTAMDIKKLKAKYPHADNIMSALMAQTSQTLKNQYKGDQRRDEQDKKQVEQDKKHNTRFRELEQRIWNIVMKNDLKEGKK